MSTATRDMIRLKLETADKWTCISDLHMSTNLHPDTISRILRSNRDVFKSEIVPNDRFRRKQWAFHTKDTTNWDNAVPVKLASKTRRRRQLPLPVIQGASSMCLPASTAAKPSLVQAVTELVLKEFLAGTKFSAHDVTKRVRELANQSTTTINPAETGTVHVKGQAVPRIEHEDVKNIVHELFHTGQMVGYGRHYNGSYWDYDLVANLPASTGAATVAVPSTTPDPVPTVADGSSYDGSSTI